MFRGLLTMNDPCPVCGMHFQREDGYFLGAMYISYAASSGLLIVLFFAASLLLPAWDSYVVALLVLVPFLLITPVLFRYSRVLWVYLDRTLDPRGALGDRPEQSRPKQLAVSATEPPVPPPGEPPA
jgi:hypothetical protein